MESVVSLLIHYSKQSELSVHVSGLNSSLLDAWLLCWLVILFS